jgi:hypothetical protein
LFGFRAEEFHQACDGMGSCVVVVRAENGRIAVAAVAYNEDGFIRTDRVECTHNQNGFIVSINEDVSCGAQFDRNLKSGGGIWNHPGYGPFFDNDLAIASYCSENQYSNSEL